MQPIRYGCGWTIATKFSGVANTLVYFGRAEDRGLLTLATLSTNDLSGHNGHPKYGQKMVENSELEISIFFKAFNSETV